MIGIASVLLAQCIGVATDQSGTPAVTICGPLPRLPGASANDLSGGWTIGYVLGILLKFMVPMIGLYFMAMLLYGGYMVLSSEGDAKKLGSAQGTIMWALIGLVVVVSSALISRVVSAILGTPSFI